MQKVKIDGNAVSVLNTVVKFQSESLVFANKEKPIVILFTTS